MHEQQRDHGVGVRDEPDRMAVMDRWPGAPMTAFLIGLASGAAAADPGSQAVAVADRIVTRLVDRWPAPSAPGTP